MSDWREYALKNLEAGDWVAIPPPDDPPWMFSHLSDSVTRTVTETTDQEDSSDSDAGSASGD